MPALVSSELVERAWQRVDGLGAPDVLKLQKQSGKFQPELVGFVLGFVHDLSAEGAGIALYAMLVLFEMFQAVPARKWAKVKDSAILRLWVANRELSDDLLAREFDREAMAQFVDQSTEPAALQYVVDALVDAQEESGELAPDEVAHVLAMLKTVVDALHDAWRPRTS